MAFEPARKPHQIHLRTSNGSMEEARGARPPLIFWPQWGPRPEGTKKIFLGPGPPLSQTLEDPPPPPPRLSEGLDPPLRTVIYFGRRRSLDWRVTYRIVVHTIADSFSYRHEKLSSLRTQTYFRPEIRRLKAQGHQTTECFQISQKCLKCFSLLICRIWSCP